MLKISTSVKKLIIGNVSFQIDLPSLFSCKSSSRNANIRPSVRLSVTSCFLSLKISQIIIKHDTKLHCHHQQPQPQTQQPPQQHQTTITA